jgi:hypothetical protein
MIRAQSGAEKEIRDERETKKLSDEDEPIPASSHCSLAFCLTFVLDCLSTRLLGRY